jgi:hypothetical protein
MSAAAAATLTATTPPLPTELLAVLVDNSEDPNKLSVRPLYTLVTQLVSTGFIGVVCFLLFCALRTRWSAVYAPKELAR